MPKRRGRRNNIAVQRREAARIVSQAALRDKELAESINRLSPGEIALKLQNMFGTFNTFVVNNYDRGEVLSNSRGQGTLQQIGSTVTHWIEASSII